MDTCAPDEYRLLEPADWKKVRIDASIDAQSNLDALLLSIARELQFVFSGFVSTKGDTPDFAYTMTRSKRREAETPPPSEKFMRAAELLGTSLRGQVEEVQTGNDLDQIVMLLGLQEGYAGGHDPQVIHTKNEVMEALPGRILYPAHIHAARPDADSVYREDAVLIGASPEDIPLLHRLAAEFKQQRYTIEDTLGGKSYTYERIK